MNSSGRYYDSSGSQDEIRPGRISAELRAALNIAENDLPIWIYRMRALGYPPGWLNKAIVDTNDIFDTDAFDEGGSGVKRGSSSQEIQYDHSKLIEYPGFNTPMPPNCVDYHYYINMPPMLPHQQLDYAKKHMNSHLDEQPQKRARTSSPPHEKPSTSSDTSHNKSAPEVIVISDDDDEEEHDIKEKKEVEETPNASSGLSQPVEEKPSEVSLHKSTSEPHVVELEDDKIPRKIESNLDKNNEKSEQKVESTPKTTPNPLTGCIKLVSRGTPMPKLVKRAPLEKFSEGVVGELLYFENTPTSSGKFDSIKGLLNTIRKPKNNDSNKSF